MKESDFEMCSSLINIKCEVELKLVRTGQTKKFSHAPKNHMIDDKCSL